MSKKKEDIKGHPLQVIRWFDRTNTLGGWTPSFHSDNCLSKVFWFILFIMGTYLTLEGVNDSIVQYYERNTLTKIENSYFTPARLNLPAVAICHSNRVHCGNLHKLIVNTSEGEVSCKYIIAV